jgi:hypothetical protein
MTAATSWESIAPVGIFDLSQEPGIAGDGGPVKSEAEAAVELESLWIGLAVTLRSPRQDGRKRARILGSQGTLHQPSVRITVPCGKFGIMTFGWGRCPNRPGAVIRQGWCWHNVAEATWPSDRVAMPPFWREGVFLP